MSVERCFGAIEQHWVHTNIWKMQLGSIAGFRKLVKIRFCEVCK